MTGVRFDFTGQVVIVTGASGGLGAALARAFAEAGAAVVVHYHQNQTAAQTVADEIEGAGGRCLLLRADVRSPDGAETLITQTEHAFGQVDVLVNNAGTYPLHGLLEMRAEDWAGVIEANLTSVFLCTQRFAQAVIVAERPGAVVNIASIEAENPAPAHSHYNAAKAGVVMHTRAAAAELGPQGVRVNAVSPGLLWRPGLDEAWPEGVARYQEAAPLGRLGQPADVAGAVLFLASPAAAWITGAHLVVDGGVLTHQVY